MYGGVVWCDWVLGRIGLVVGLGVGESQCGGVAVWGSRGLGEWGLGGVAVRGVEHSGGRKQGVRWSGGVVGWGKKSMRESQAEWKSQRTNTCLMYVTGMLHIVRNN